MKGKKILNGFVDFFKPVESNSDDFDFNNKDDKSIIAYISVFAVIAILTVVLVLKIK